MLSLTVLINGAAKYRAQIAEDRLERLVDAVVRNWDALASQGWFAVVVTFDGVAHIVANSRGVLA